MSQSEEIVVSVKNFSLRSVSNLTDDKKVSQRPNEIPTRLIY